MSVQFGILNLDGKPVRAELFEKVLPMIAPYGPDGTNSYIKNNLGVLFCAFHSTPEAVRETQPHMSLRSGATLTWDGRLDNRAELVRGLSESVTSGAADVSIVAAAYERWGKDCFEKIVGDWALSIWDQNERTLFLAKDFAGIRNLYYTVDNAQVTWSTILDPLVLTAGHTFGLNEEYIAGLLMDYPGAHLTPYVGIQSVPPCSYFSISAHRQSTRKYWDFDPRKQIRYRSDTEYEEHFRTVFSESVSRRLRSHAPILAELSGGMDSSSIVCVADQIIAQGKACPPRLDTVSRYDDSEPNWDERPYFTKVEEKRGRAGYHIDVGAQQKTESAHEGDYFRATPDSSAGPPPPNDRFIEHVRNQGYRALLCGIGGDEAMGGVPNPVPELADYLIGVRFRQLASQLKKWCLAQRKPWMHVLFEVIRDFVPRTGLPEPLKRAPWLRSDFLKRQRRTFFEKYRSFALFGPRPSFQSNLSTIAAMRDELGFKSPDRFLCLERRYPYLDRNLLEFVYAIPGEQILRPGQRRSLMRRALRGIDPKEILERKRKAFVARAPMTYLANDWASLSTLIHQMALNSLGIIDSEKLLEELQKARSGEVVSLPHLLRPLVAERWLRSLAPWKVLNDLEPCNKTALQSGADARSSVQA
ncbi:MAG: hypothetical protein DMG76_35330 [Acidobacteria bacterium]|nr:MAG: hypothetical protein DMG76_35330 [Acidobacteriota bacterium]